MYKLTQTKKPSQTVLIGDSVQDGKDYSVAGDPSNVSDLTVKQGSSYLASPLSVGTIWMYNRLESRHDHGANIVWADGHATWTKNAVATYEICPNWYADPTKYPYFHPLYTGN